MVLGSRNFNYKYNETFVTREDSLKIIEEFEKLGGEIIDTAFNYKSHEIIKEYGWKGKVITKCNNKHEFFDCFEELGVDRIYCVMARENDKEFVNFLRKEREIGTIEKFGLSCYLPSELTRSYFNAFQLPCDPVWFELIPLLSIYADVYIRSYYNHWKKNYDIDCVDGRYNRFFKREDKRIIALNNNPKIDFVVGCDNIEQLRENMEKFK